MQPVYVGTIKDVAVRFYPPQSDHDRMPWVATEDLARALGMNHRDKALWRTAVRKALSRAGALRFPDSAKCIRMEDGARTDVLAFQAAQGFMASDRYDDDTRVAFREQALTAAARSSPELFRRNKAGELLIHSQPLAMLLGIDDEAVVD